MRRIISLGFAGIALTIGLSATTAAAGMIIPEGVQSSHLDLDGVHYDYTITLTNSVASTDRIGTFWFSWVPGKDFMTNNPLSEMDPTGWTSRVTHGGIGDGYAIQWVADSSANDLAIGGSLTFGFKSAETPAELAGMSPFFPAIPEGTSFVYNAQPFSADSARFLVTPQSVPEPSSLLLSLVGGLAFFARKRWNRSAAVPLGQP